MNIDYFENKNYYAIRKPHNIPSSFWDQECFLDLLFSCKSQNIKNIVNKQKQIFWTEKEIGMLNRLDNKTSWFLFFAKTKEFFDKHKLLQSQNKSIKTYIAEVSWNFEYDSITINFPIMHHIHDNQKMIIVQTKYDISKWRWRIHECTTFIKKVYFENNLNKSILMINITKWIRHQIRIHLKSIWYPIIWDDLYWNFSLDDNLHLRSIWLEYK